MKTILIALSMVLCSPFALAQTTEKAKPQKQETAKATFAGGCFWCLEPPFDEVDGVLSTVSGYSGGKAEDANYPKVSSGVTDHIEVMQVTYDPNKVSFDQLLDVFWKNHDPYNGIGQFCDKGLQYRPAIFFHDEAQKQMALKSKKAVQDNPELAKFGEVQTELISFEAFYPAEEYHQDYYQNNKLKYKLYRYGCKRDKRLKEIWK